MSKKLQVCAFCGHESRTKSAARRHKQSCHLQPGRPLEPLHFTDLAGLPFTVKSPYRKD